MSGDAGVCQSTHEFCEDITWEQLWISQLLLPVIVAVCLCPGMAVLNLTYFSINSRRWNRWCRRYLGTPDKPPMKSGLLHTCNILQMLLSGVYVVLFVWRSYSHAVSWPSRVLELTFCAFFIFHYLLKACIYEFDLLYPLTKPSLVDAFSIVPPLYYLTTSPSEIPWVSLGYMRIYYCVWTYRDVANQSYFIQQLSEVSRSLINLLLDTAALVVNLACTVMLLEILGDPSFLGVEDTVTMMGEITFEKMVYWIFTTISTVGYGDFTPQHMLSRLVVIYAIVTGVVLFSVQTGKLMTLQTLEDAGKGRFQADGRHDFLVVVGGAVSQFSWVLPNFLTELYELENAETIPFPRAVLMAPRETHPELREFIRSMPKHARERIHYFYGNVMSTEDMHRVHLVGAKLAVVLPDVRAADPNQEDQDNILRALAMKRACPKINLRLMVMRPESKVRAVNVGIQDSRCFSINELKSYLVCESCRCRGFSTLISNLISSDVGDDAEQEMEEMIGRSPQWVQHYRYGFAMDFHGLAIDDRFMGKTFVEFAEEAFKCGVAPIAVQIDGQIVLNPPCKYRFSKDDIVFAVHPGGSHLNNTHLANLQNDWRTEFVRRQAAHARRYKQRRSGPPSFVDAGVLREDTDSKSRFHKARATRINEHRTAVRTEDDVAMPQFALWARGAQNKTFGGACSQLQHGSQKEDQVAANAIQVEEIEELEELTEILAEKGHHVLLVLLESSMWQHVEAFVKCLRAEYLPVFQPIIILSEFPPPRQVLKETAWTFHEVSFMIGIPTSIKDLYKAGMRTARAVVLLSGSGPPNCDWHMVDAVAVMTLVNIESEALGIHTVVELLNEDSVRLLTRYPLATLADHEHDEAETLPTTHRGSRKTSILAQKRKSLTPHLAASSSKLFRNESTRGSRKARTLKVSPTEDQFWSSRLSVQGSCDAEKEPFNLCPRFSSGNIFTASCLGVLMARAYYTPGIIELVEAILLGDKKGQESFPYQIRIPATLSGKPYSRMIDKLLSGWPMQSSSSDDCQKQESQMDVVSGAVPLGVYRIRGTAGAVNGVEDDCVSHVITNPPRTFILEITDLVFVIGSAAFGSACLNEGILVEAGPSGYRNSVDSSADDSYPVADYHKEREARAADLQKEREGRAVDFQKEKEGRAVDFPKEREGRVGFDIPERESMRSEEF